MQLSIPLVKRRLSPTFFRSNFITKLFNWEYWPFWAIYWPLVPYWVWLSWRCKSFFFFTASNPGIEFGGMMGESKSKIYDLIPNQYLPVSVLIKPKTSKTEVLSLMKGLDLDFPIILKPDVGQRGWMVEKIRHEDDLGQYLKRIEVDFLMQEFVDYPVELGVFYHRLPYESVGEVSSIVVKEMLHVVGDGQQTIKQLIGQIPRASIQLETLRNTRPELMKQVPIVNEKVELVSIGNHCRGTKFLNGEDLITPALTLAIDKLSQQIDGFYFGRFDMKCTSIADLMKGQGIKIMELNGAGAEPAHIYHPGRSIWKGYRDIVYHLDLLADIAIVNHKMGVPYASFWTGIDVLFKSRAYYKKHKA